MDLTIRTEFLRRSCARALTPRTIERVHALRELERLMHRANLRLPLGVQGFLLSSLARKYPISARAMLFELRGYEPQRLVEVAEQIELRLRVQAPRT